MSPKSKCKNCKKGYKTLTKEGLCAYCFKDKHRYWSDEYCSEKEREARNKGAKRT